MRTTTTSATKRARDLTRKAQAYAAKASRGRVAHDGDYHDFLGRIADSASAVRRLSPLAISADERQLALDGIWDAYAAVLAAIPEGEPEDFGDEHEVEAGDGWQVACYGQLD